MSRNRCVHLFDEDGKPIGHARLRSDASPQTIAAIEELARLVVASIKLDRSDSEGAARLKRSQERFAARLVAAGTEPQHKGDTIQNLECMVADAEAKP